MTEAINGNNYSYIIKNGDNLTRIAQKNNTTIANILKLNPYIKDKNKIYAGKTLVLPDNKAFVPREGAQPDKMNISTVTVNGNEISQINGKDLSANFYANQFSALSGSTLNDDTPATKIVVEMKTGNSMSDKDTTPFSILNKVLADHLDNNSVVMTDADGNRFAKSEYLEKSDLYQAFISEDVNGDNFTGDDNKLLSRGEAGNKVQLPSVEVDSNGVKYFTLHGAKDEILYFDSTGKKVSFENGAIVGATEPALQPEVNVEDDSKAISAPQNQEFLIRQSYKDDKQLNMGAVFVNGEAVELSEVDANFYRNNPNSYMGETLNDSSSASRLDVQLSFGALDARDASAKDILNKLLGTNFKKASSVIKNGDGYKLVNTKLENTDLYRAFVSEAVNSANFADGKIIRSDSGVNTVQFPALEADANGVKYYTLHTNDGKIMYFNDKGEEVQPN